MKIGVRNMRHGNPKPHTIANTLGGPKAKVKLKRAAQICAVTAMIRADTGRRFDFNAADHKRRGEPREAERAFVAIHHAANQRPQSQKFSTTADVIAEAVLQVQGRRSVVIGNEVVHPEAGRHDGGPRSFCRTHRRDNSRQ